MKAAVYDGVGKLSIKEVEKPQVKEDNIIIKINSCALCGTDLKAYIRGISRITIPVILGHEFVGTITEVGKGITDARQGEKVSGFKIGDRVTMATTIPCGSCEFCNRGLGNLCENVTPVGTVVNGALAEYMEVPSAGIRMGNLLKVPDNVSDDEGSISEPLGCVINGQINAEVGSGDVVVIVGAGPIGCLHIEVAKIKGAKKVIVIQRSEKRLELARRLGVDESICSLKEEPVEKVKQITDGKGADVIIIACPSNESAEKAFLMVKKHGRINYFSSLPKDNPKINIDANLIHYRELKISGASDSTPKHHQMALDLLSGKKINTNVLITHRLNLDQILEGLEIMKSGKGLKVVIKP